MNAFLLKVLSRIVFSLYELSVSLNVMLIIGSKY